MEVEEVVVVEVLEMALAADGEVDMEEEVEEDWDREATEEYGVPETAVVVGFPVVIKSQRKVKTNQTC